MLLFELATNAVKHGALRPGNGSVPLTWWPLPDGALHVRWHEETAGAPDAARGGSALMRAVRETLEASLEWQRRAEGCRMDLVLPAHRCHVDEPPDPTHGPDAQPTWQEVADRPQRVLVVEDNPLIADGLATLVRGSGVPYVATALTLAEAQARLTAELFDFVLLDLALGTDSAEGLSPLLAETEAALVSGRSPGDLPEAFTGPPLLAKPFQAQDVAVFLDAWRGRRAPQGAQLHPAGVSGQSMR